MGSAVAVSRPIRVAVCVRKCAAVEGGASGFAHPGCEGYCRVNFGLGKAGSMPAFPLFQPGIDKVPVNEMIDECLEKIGPPVLVV
jgi:hypothetical protein